MQVKGLQKIGYCIFAYLHLLSGHNFVVKYSNKLAYKGKVREIHIKSNNI